MRKTLIAIGVLVLVAFVGGYYFSGFTGNIIAGDYEENFTKAICNSGQCLDVYVECGAKSIKITPLTPYHPVDLNKFNITNEIRC